MNGFGNWLRNIFMKISAGLRRFMEGRYGTDRLNTAILIVGVVAALIRSFFPQLFVNLALWLISYVMMFWAIFRMLSRNVYKRYQENRKFLQLIDRIKDRQHRYYDCPQCHQTVRVPRGKGKIAITCPKCKEKFVRKT